MTNPTHNPVSIGAVDVLLTDGSRHRVDVEWNAPDESVSVAYLLVPGMAPNWDVSADTRLLHTAANSSNDGLQCCVLQANHRAESFGVRLSWDGKMVAQGWSEEWVRWK